MAPSNARGGRSAPATTPQRSSRPLAIVIRRQGITPRRLEPLFAKRHSLVTQSALVHGAGILSPSAGVLLEQRDPAVAIGISKRTTAEDIDPAFANGRVESNGKVAYPPLPATRQSVAGEGGYQPRRPTAQSLHAPARRPAGKPSRYLPAGLAQRRLGTLAH